jgi:glycosidase
MRENMITPKNILVTIMLLIISKLSAYDIKRIEPPFWWAGFNNKKLQLMVYGKDISKLTPKINYKGIQINKVHQVDSPNYLFIDLLLKKDKPKKFTIKFNKAKKTVLERDYEIFKRQKVDEERETLNSSDVIYLITPDRYANGDKNNDEVSSLLEGSDRSNKDGRHGGDIQGIINNLDYIEDMGFTQIWLNPVLENNQADYSYHGYSTTDYYKIDPRFGSNKLYQDLSKEGRNRNIGLIKDLVLNHIGSGHWWMNDLPTDDWLNYQGNYRQTNHIHETVYDPHLPTSQKDLFTEGWFVETMPDLNQKNPFVATYLKQVSLWWIEYANLSSLRIDTYPYVDKKFTSQWSKTIMNEYPNFVFFGEAWMNNPTTVSYWQKGSKTYDDYQSYIPSMKDFPLQKSLITGLLSKDSWDTGIGNIYRTLANDFQYGNPYNLVIFAGNHDMQRTFSQLNERLDLLKMALSFIATTRGIPQIYAGTEIAMPSTEDHGELRKDFPGGWEDDKVNAFDDIGLSSTQIETKSFVKQLLNWRKSNQAVANGKLIHYPVTNGIYVYFRVFQGDKLMVIMNNKENEEILNLDVYRETLADRKNGFDIISGKKYNLSKDLILNPKTALILELE